VAINDVLPLKAAQRDPIANLKWFWASDTRDLISIVTCTFTMRRHLIRLTSAHQRHLLPPVWQRLVGFCCVHRVATKQNAEFTNCGWELRSYF